MESIKQLYSVFTNKILFVEWILQINIAMGKYLTNKKARLEVDIYAIENDTLDMRTAPPAIRRGVIHDKAILKERWDLCKSCEFLTEKNSCLRCGCYMAVKHKLIAARCPIGKWERYSVTLSLIHI